MGWNSTTKILTGPGFTKIALNGQGDLQLALGTTSNSQIRMMAGLDGFINPMAKFKSFRSNATTITADSQRGNCGIVIPEFNAISPLFTSGETYAWKYARPDGTNFPLRAKDFISADSPSSYGYYSDAPRNVLCCLQSNATVVFNTINENGSNDPIVFYAFSKQPTLNGIFDRRPSDTIGIGSPYEHSSAQLASSLAIEDLQTNYGKALYGTNHRLGLALKTGSTYSFLPCEEDLRNDLPDLTIDMVQILASSIFNLTPADYQAVGCLRIYDTQAADYVYAPLHVRDWDGTDSQKNTFTLSVGGISNYELGIEGIANTDSGTPVNTLHNSGNGIVYLTLNIKNKTDRLHRTSSRTFSQWKLQTHCTGERYDSQSPDTPSPIDINLTSSIYSVDGVQINPSNPSFTIAAGAIAKMVFKVDGVWDNLAHQVSITSGNVSLVPQLKFGSQSFDMGIPARLDVINP